MSYHRNRTITRWITGLVHFAAVSALLCSGAAAIAQNVVRIEEDWELVLGNPDQLVCGPQVVTTMSPFGDLDSTYFTLEINHRSVPYWTPGGLSVHQWYGENRIESWDRADRSVMSTNSEVVTWTQQLYIENGNRLVFQIRDGVSSTWGPFGYSGLFKVGANWNQSGINEYSPAVSIAASGVPYCGNRVQSLKIKEVRVTLDDGRVLTDTTERVAHLLVE
jgi:hypothetical protein